METRSGRRLSSPPPRGARRRRDPPDADLIGALPNDILLLVLVRLRCVCTAARTGLLSRRWRGLWTRLPDLDFRRVAPARVESALSRFAASPFVSLLDIRIDVGHTAEASSLLRRAAALLSPVDLYILFPGPREDRVTPIELPCFHRTTSIRLVILLRVMPSTVGEFTALERLTLVGRFDDLGALLARCPRLRQLSVTFSPSSHFLCITPPSNSEFPAALESLDLSGNIVDLGIFLNRCPRLHVISVTFRGIASTSLEAALATIEAMEAHSATVSLLAVCIPIAQSDTATLLCAAARLSPQKLFLLTHLSDTQDPPYSNVDLPCFHRATSIEIRMPNICFTGLLDGEFSELKSLSLKECIIDDLGTLVSCCPRLRVLKVKAAITSKRDITVHSSSLQELVLGTYTECRGINIVTPMLKELELEVQADKDINVFISAPMVDKVSWRRSYTGLPIVFGFWHLQNLSLERRGLLTDHVLFVDMCASDSSNAEMNFAQEIERVLVPTSLF